MTYRALTLEVGTQALKQATHSMEEFRRAIEVLVFGPIRTCRAVVPMMRSQGGGTIVNIGSVSGIISLPGISVYSCAKHGLDGTCHLTPQQRIHMRKCSLQ